MTASSGRRYDAHHLDVAARSFGWDTVWGPERAAARVTRGPWTIEVWFWAAGGFCSAQVYGPTTAAELDPAAVFALLEHEGGIPGPAT